MQVHLVDGTYELFRAYYGPPPAKAPDGREVGAVRGLARSMLALVRNESATHVAVAFDHVVESFRNELLDGYKTGEGIEPELFAQFELAERVTHALGMVTWPMIEYEADDALATAAKMFAEESLVERVLICSPDKDLTQCVRGQRTICLDRRRRLEMDHDGVREKFGVSPESIPDWLALVGDSADGIPGVPRWGARSASAALACYERLDQIPEDPAAWEFKVRGAAALAKNLNEHREDARLYRRLALLVENVPLTERLEDLEWRGARRAELEAICAELGETELIERVPRWRAE
jgi:5'-3' exonuclease